MYLHHTEQDLIQHLQKTQKLFEKRNQITDWKLNMFYLKTIHFEKLYDRYNKEFKNEKTIIY